LCEQRLIDWLTRQKSGGGAGGSARWWNKGLARIPAPCAWHPMGLHRAHSPVVARPGHNTPIHPWPRRTGSRCNLVTFQTRTRGVTATYFEALLMWTTIQAMVSGVHGVDKAWSVRFLHLTADEERLPVMCAGQALRERPALRAAGRAMAQPEAVLGALWGLHHRNAALSRRNKGAHGKGCRGKRRRTSESTSKIMRSNWRQLSSFAHNARGARRVLQRVLVAMRDIVQMPSTGRRAFSTQSMYHGLRKPQHSPFTSIRSEKRQDSQRVSL